VTDPTNDFQDITQVVMSLAIDKGALTALVDDPILLTEHDESEFYANAKIRGIQALRDATRLPSEGYVDVYVAASNLECTECHAEPGDPCMAADGSTLVGIHEERIEMLHNNTRRIIELYRQNNVNMDRRDAAA
jgi:hypothetical protein